MIDTKYFFAGFKSIKGVGSPAIALGASFIAIGALLKNLGFTIQESIFSTFLTYALPGSLVMAESMLIGASLINIFIAVWLVNARLYPMTVALMPLLMHENQPRWKYYLSCHFIAVSSWLIMKDNYEEIEKENRIDFWIGIGTATWSVAIFATVIGSIGWIWIAIEAQTGRRALIVDFEDTSWPWYKIWSKVFPDYHSMPANTMWLAAIWSFAIILFFSIGWRSVNGNKNPLRSKGTNTDVIATDLNSGSSIR